MIFNGKQIEFLLFEEVLTNMFEDEEDYLEDYFAKHRIIRLILDCGKGLNSKTMLSFFDKLLIQAVDKKQIQRWVRCKECKQKGKKGYFLAEESFKVTDKMKKCKESEAHRYRKISKSTQFQNWMTSMFRRGNQGNLHCKNIYH